MSIIAGAGRSCPATPTGEHQGGMNTCRLSGPFLFLSCPGSQPWAGVAHDEEVFPPQLIQPECIREARPEAHPAGDSRVCPVDSDIITEIKADQ